LRDAIDLLGRANPFSFLHQVEKAIAENDAIAVQHRVAKWLETYFDALFAANRVLHPGEKRLVAFAERECAVKPSRFAENVAAVVSLPSDETVPLMERMLAALLEVVRATEPPVASATLAT